MKKVTIPAPLIVVIEDVGWWNGFDGSNSNQPFRTGMNREHCLEDYEALALFGKELKTQIIAGFVWCEWDRNNLLKKIPSATWMGKSWENPVKKTQLFDKAAEIINRNSDTIELGFHGLGHEFWDNGCALRTEFHDTDGKMRSRCDIIKHFEVLENLYKNSGIVSPAPEIFIPPALQHSFGNTGSGFQKILNDFGFKFVLTRFDKAKQYAPPLYENFTKDCGVTLIERGISPVKWNKISAKPVFSFDWPVLSLHWSNILHFNPGENSSIVKLWANFLNEGAKKRGLILLANAKESLIQLIYNHLAEIRIYKDGVKINIEKAEKVLPDSSEKVLYIKAEINPKRPVKIEGGKILSLTKEGETETLIKIKPDESNTIKLSLF